MMEDFSFYHSGFLRLLCPNGNSSNYEADLLESGAQLTAKVIARRLFGTFLQKNKRGKVIPVYLLMFCIPQVENGTQRRAENQAGSAQQKRSRRGWSVLPSLCVSLRATSTKNCALSPPALDDTTSLRRDRGRWVGYVREAGGNKWSQFAGTVRRKRAWTAPPAS